MRQAVLLACLTAAGLSAPGCATVAHGVRQTVRVTSDPAGAAVTVLSSPPGRDAVVRSTPGVTPIALSLTRRDPHIVIRVEKDGCAPVEIRLKRSVSGWIAGNLIVANPLSMQGMTDPATQYPVQLAVGLPVTFGIDALSGGAYKLPKAVHASLCAR